MRRSLFALSAAALALTAVPALADQAQEPDAPAVLQPCQVAAGTLVLSPGKDLQGDIDTPLLPGDETTVTAVLDLAGQAEGTTGSVVTTMTWLVGANDYDLLTSGGGDSADINVPQGLEPSETAFGGGIGHCEPFTVTAVNFAAPVVADSLQVALVATADEAFEE